MLIIFYKNKWTGPDLIFLMENHWINYYLGWVEKWVGRSIQPSLERCLENDSLVPPPWHRLVTQYSKKRTGRLRWGLKINWEYQEKISYNRKTKIYKNDRTCTNKGEGWRFLVINHESDFYSMLWIQYQSDFL